MMDNEYFKCDYADERCKRGKKDGWCEHKRFYCDGNGCFPFDEKVTNIENKDVCKMSSIFGNYYISLTDNQIDALKNGVILGLTNQEYNIFIRKG